MATKTPTKRTRERRVKSEPGLSVAERLGLMRADQSSWRRKLQASKVRFTDAKKKIYIETLAEGGRKGIAAAAAGVHPETVLEHLENDPDFFSAYAVAESTWADTIVNHAQKIMIEGEKTITTDKEGRVTESTKYPQQLIIAELKKVDEGYRDKPTIDIAAMGGGVLIAPASMTPAEWIENQDTLNNEKGEKAPDRSKTLLIEHDENE
jgi:hypothetical protein